MTNDLSDDEKKIKSSCNEDEQFVRSFVKKGRTYPAKCRGKKKSKKKKTDQPKFVEKPPIRIITTPVRIRTCAEDAIKAELNAFVADKDLNHIREISKLAKKNGISDELIGKLTSALMETYGKNYDIEEMIDIMKSYHEKAGRQIYKIADFITTEQKRQEIRELKTRKTET